MDTERWEVLSEWLNAWLPADPREQERLRAELAVQRPDLMDEAHALATSSTNLGGFLETPALVLAARELVEEEALLAPGTMIGPYRVVDLLARGGMGDVYRATDPRLCRDVAIKVLAPAKTSDPRRLEGFLREARVTASIDHPHVVRVYDVGRFEAGAYLVAELLEGETLRTRIARGALPVDEVLTIALEIAKGLVAAHDAGLVHRDLKPENIFLTRSGTTKLLDFGIAKLAQDETVQDGRSTLTGVVLGTAGYLSPEQIRGAAIDARADLFALGAVLFEMLMGTRAFGREHVVETLHAILHDPPPGELATRIDLPPALTAIAARLLEKAPGARFQSAAEVIAALERVDPAARGVAAGRRIAARGGERTAVGDRHARRGRPSARWAVVSAIAALTALAAWQSGRLPGALFREAPVMTLAVVPFRSLPPAAGDEGLLETGLADVLISRLGQLAEVHVLPLTATERLQGQADPVRAAERLGATHVLTGTLQRETERVRATVRLVSTRDDRTLWSTPVDTDTSSIFSIQDIVVTRVIEELVPQLETGTRRQLAQSGTHDNEAFEAYLRGRAYVARPSRAELTRAVALFEQAIARDPRYADAWAGLASAYKRLPLFDAVPSEAFLEARRAAARALELQEDHAEALAALGFVAFWYEWDYARAESFLRRALERQPSSTDALVVLGHLFSNLGRHDEALVEVRRARALDQAWMAPRALEGQFLFMARRYEAALARLNEAVPLDPRFSAAQIMRLYPLIALERYEEAIEGCDRVIALNHSLGLARPHSWVLALRGYALARMGRQAEAIAALAELRDQASEQYVPPYNEAVLLHGLGRREAALARLRDAVAGRDLLVTFLGVDPKWDALRDDPAFRAIVARANLLEVSDRYRR